MPCSCLVLPFLLFGCISRVPSTDLDDSDAAVDARSDGGPADQDPPDADPTCLLPPFGRDPQSATFVGDRLWVGGSEGVTWADLGAGVLIAGGRSEPLSTGLSENAKDIAKFHALDDGAFGRISAEPGAASVVDLIDLRAPDAPVIVARALHEGVLKGEVGVSAGRMVVCTDGLLTRVVAEAMGTVLVDTYIADPCRGDGLAAGGPFLVAWTQGEGNLVPRFQLFAVSAAGPESRLDFSFNPSGVHAYGDIRAVALGPRRAIVDVQNRRYAWLLDLTGEGNDLNELDFSMSADQSLLGFADDLAIFGGPSGLTSVDVAEVASPHRGPSWVAGMGPGGAAPRLLAASPTHLALRGTDGALLVVPLAGGDPVPIVCAP